MVSSIASVDPLDVSWQLQQPATRNGHIRTLVCGHLPNLHLLAQDPRNCRTNKNYDSNSTPDN